MTVKVFISYSWDSEEHKQWVVALTNKLRNVYGIDATIDVLSGINNLNKMMVEGVANNEKIIIIITKGYTIKADSFKGGVGYETDLLINKVRQNENSIVVVKKEKCDLPFYISNFNYIDFTNGINQAKLDELVMRLNNTPPYKIEGINTNPRRVKSKEVRDIIDMDDDDLIPDLKEFSDKDLEKHVEATFIEMISTLNGLLDKTKIKNTNFDYNYSVKSIIDKHINYFNQSPRFIKVHSFQLFKNDKEVFSYKLWSNNGTMGCGIYGSQNNMHENEALNSYSFWVSFRVDNRQIKIFLGMPSMFGDQRNLENGKDLAKVVYNDMKLYLER